jgi:hypothetical protein
MLQLKNRVAPTTGSKIATVCLMKCGKDGSLDPADRGMMRHKCFQRINLYAPEVGSDPTVAEYQNAG